MRQHASSFILILFSGIVWWNYKAIWVMILLWVVTGTWKSGNV